MHQKILYMYVKVLVLNFLLLQHDVRVFFLKLPFVTLVLTQPGSGFIRPHFVDALDLFRFGDLRLGEPLFIKLFFEGVVLVKLRPLLIFVFVVLLRKLVFVILNPVFECVPWEAVQFVERFRECVSLDNRFLFWNLNIVSIVRRFVEFLRLEIMQRSLARCVFSAVLVVVLKYRFQELALFDSVENPLKILLQMVKIKGVKIKI